MIGRAGRFALALLLLTGSAISLAAQEIDLQTYELENGLKVILAPDPSATAVAVNVWYDAGSRREPPGRSGFAHLFEHLMFQGSANVPPGLHSSLVTSAGGVNNAYLIVDNTAFFQTLPPDRYNLGLWLEAERMRSLEITEPNLRREIEVVKEERRLSFENSPYGTSRLEAWFNLPYSPEGCFGYAHSQIGSREDLDASTLADVQHFFDTYYVPNNATLVVTGLFDPAEARGIIQNYFGSIPRSPEPPAVVCERPFTVLPASEEIEDSNATLPSVMYTYGTVPVADEDSDAINLLVSILAEGESSRLFQSLVRDEQVAVQVTGFPWERVGPGIVWLFAVANQGVDIGRVEAVMDETIAEVRDNGVTQAELEKARNNYLANSIRERVDVGGLAEAIQWANHNFGDPEAAFTRLDRIRSLTTEDLRRVANEYLVPGNRAVVITRPAAEGGA